MIEVRHFAADHEIYQVEHARAIIHYENFGSLVNDPSQHFKKIYGWGTPEFLSTDLIGRIGQALQAIGASVRLQSLHPTTEEILIGQPAPATSEPSPQLIVNLYEELGEIGGLMLGLSVFGVRPSSAGGSDGGLGFLPILRGQAHGEVPLYPFDDTFFEFSADADLLKRLAMVLRPGLPIKIQRPSGLGDLADGRFALGIRHGQATAEPKTLFSFPGGSRLTIQQFRLLGGVEKKSGSSIESFIELGLSGCRAVLSLSGADGFVSKAVSRNQLEASFDVRIGWSNSKGIYFDGSAGLDVAIPLGVDLGPIHLQLLRLGLKTGDEGLELETSATVSLTLGPLLVSLDRLGLDLKVSFNGGNLGLFGLSPNFKPPSAVGLSVDAQGVTGGVFLKIDPPNYAGVLELSFQDQIDLTAFGLITTKLPDGRPGFSLVISILAEFQPIQLGLGFALTGVGGLIAVNRQFNQEAIQLAFKTHSLDDILFPQNPIKDAVKLIEAIQSILPPREGYHVFGPMAKLFWGGSRRLVNFEIGIFIQIGGPLKIVLIGHAWSRLPSDDSPLLVINVDVLGVIDFAEQRIAFDATLFDSRVLDIHLDGQMALRANWSKGEENFALSVGGFHPQFQQIPPGFPQLRRLAMVVGDNPRLSLTMYLAITTNTLQVGAKLELWADKLGFTITGGASFDALFTFSPFSFLVNLKAWVHVNR